MSAGSGFVVGIDGGATRARYLLADAQGVIVARAEGRGSLLGASDDRKVLDRVIRRVSSLAEQAGARLPVDAICAGLAGAAGQQDARTRLEERLREGGLARRVRVVPDSEVAFEDAFGHGLGILLVAGTGSIAVARVEGDVLRRTGGWGALLGDEGSGYRLGLEGLRAAIRGVEARGPGTGMTAALLGVLDLETAADVFHWSQSADKPDIAALAPHVIREAERGDPVAESIVSDGVSSLVDHVEALARQMEDAARPPVGLVGGLIEPGGPLRMRTVARLEEAGFQILGRPVVPARGAVRIALEL